MKGSWGHVGRSSHVHRPAACHEPQGPPRALRQRAPGPRSDGPEAAQPGLLRDPAGGPGRPSHLGGGGYCSQGHLDRRRSRRVLPSGRRAHHGLVLRRSPPRRKPRACELAHARHARSARAGSAEGSRRARRQEVFREGGVTPWPFHASTRWSSVREQAAERRLYKGVSAVNAQRRGRPSWSLGLADRAPTRSIAPAWESSVTPIPQKRADHTGPWSAPGNSITRGYATSSAPRPCRPPSSSSPSTCRRGTRLFQYGGPRPGERQGASVASPTAAR